MDFGFQNLNNSEKAKRWNKVGSTLNCSFHHISGTIKIYSDKFDYTGDLINGEANGYGVAKSNQGNPVSFEGTWETSYWTPVPYGISKSANLVQFRYGYSCLIQWFIIWWWNFKKRNSWGIWVHERRKIWQSHAIRSQVSVWSLCDSCFLNSKG